MTAPAILIGCLWLLLSASGITWLLLLKSGRSLGVWLPPVARNPVPWNLFDLWLGLVVMLSCQAASLYAAHSYLRVPLDYPHDQLLPDQQATKMIAGSVGVTAVALLLLVYLAYFRRASPRDFGWDRRRFLSDLALGSSSFVTLFGPVILIQFSLTQLWPSEHPIIELIENSETSFPIWACLFSAVIVAPVVEEFLFRVVLQGWFEKLATHPFPLATHVEPSPTDSSRTDSSSPTARWPIFASATIFALAHLGHGPDMAALFVFSCGLGFLYQQTHRALPCIVVHFLLNAWSMFTLLMSLAAKK